MKRFLGFLAIMMTVVPLGARADSEFDTAVRHVIENCVNIGREFDEMKKMAGINTAVTAVGTAAGVGAAVAGFTKESVDKKIAELEDQICNAGGCDADTVASMSDEDFFKNVLDPMAQIAELQMQELTDKSKSLGNWRTGLLAGNTATNVAGAVIAGKNRTDKSTREIIDACVAAVADLRLATAQARLDGVDAEQIAYAEGVIDGCGGWQYVDLDKIDRRATGAMWSSIAGGTVGAAGVVTSAVANSNKVRDNDAPDGKTREQNLNTASNVLAIGASAASATATVFNGTQIAAIKRAIETATECEAALDLE